MKLTINEEDRAVLARLFGPEIPGDDTSFRPALEWACHVDFDTRLVTEDSIRPMLGNLVSYCLHNGIQRQPLGWSLEEGDDYVSLGVLVMKQKAERAA